MQTISPPVDNAIPYRVNRCLDKATPTTDVAHPIKIEIHIIALRLWVIKRAVRGGPAIKANTIKTPTARKAPIAVVETWVIRR